MPQASAHSRRGLRVPLVTCPLPLRRQEAPVVRSTPRCAPGRTARAWPLSYRTRDEDRRHARGSACNRADHLDEVIELERFADDRPPCFVQKALCALALQV